MDKKTLDDQKNKDKLEPLKGKGNKYYHLI